MFIVLMHLHTKPVQTVHFFCCHVNLFGDVCSDSVMELQFVFDFCINWLQ